MGTVIFEMTPGENLPAAQQMLGRKDTAGINNCAGSNAFAVLQCNTSRFELVNFAADAQGLIRQEIAQSSVEVCRGKRAISCFHWPMIIRESDFIAIIPFGFGKAIQQRVPLVRQIAAEPAPAVMPTKHLARLYQLESHFGMCPMDCQRDQAASQAAAYNCQIGFAPIHCASGPRTARALRQWRAVLSPMLTKLGLAVTGSLIQSRAMATLVPSRKAIIASVVISIIAVIILLAMDRPPICECGYVKLWHGDINSMGNSQHIADWYTPSHIIHGPIFYAFGWLLLSKWKLGGDNATQWGLTLAVFLEAAWEVLENTPMVIDRFRSVTANWGYSGDSVLNSFADIGWMAFGFFLAMKLPIKVTIALAIIGEVVAGLVVRDGLTLTVIMLVFPIDAIAEWQAAGH